MIIGNDAGSVPIIIPDRIYVGTTSASNQTRSSLTRGVLSFRPLSTANSGGTISFYYNGGNDQTGYISNETNGIIIRSYNSVGGHIQGIDLWTVANMAKLHNKPTVLLADAKTDVAKQALVSIEYLGDYLHSLSINGTDTGIKIISTADINIQFPTGNINFIGDVIYSTSTHQIQKRVDTLNLGTGVVTEGSYTMIQGGQAVQETV